MYEERGIASILARSIEYPDNLSDKAITNCIEGKDKISLTAIGITNIIIKIFRLDKSFGTKYNKINITELT